MCVVFTCTNSPPLSHPLSPLFHPFSLPPFLHPLSVMNKGQCITKYYRWIQKNGGYIWIQSSATIAINAKNASEKNIVWVNYVLRSGTS